ncbi:MAG TPA: C10 family peptidase [Phycisphaerae bacterium]|nr:C10 family peptidase [Phycisphaerae bacterium]HRY66513.1 C10 family peptidase [Phycisphaerae bacterium]HSA28625.1 C10 family peptidase [Phycisphaerae bacterium]
MSRSLQRSTACHAGTSLDRRAADGGQASLGGEERAFLDTKRIHRLLALGVWLGLLGTTLALPVQAATADAHRARRVAVGWLRSNPAPLGAALGRPVSHVKTFRDADGRIQYHVVVLQTTGFVVVAADDGIEPVIAFVDNGSYDPSPADPLGALVTSDLPARLDAARRTQTLTPAPADPRAQAANRKWARFEQLADTERAAGLSNVSDVRVSPLLQSRWNQQDECGSPCYNYYTPQAYPCGCVATAMAQLMRFHQYPTAGIGAHSFTLSVDGFTTTAETRGGDGAGGAYAWVNMTLDPNCSTTVVQREAIGALCYDAGLSVGMDYRSDGSSADALQAKTSLVSTFGYSNAVRGYNSQNDIGPGLVGMINPNLDAGYPVILGITGTSGGHAIVSDGYGYNASTLYHHLNMGWGGSSDAWYNLPDVDSSPAFTSVYKCVYNVYVSGAGEIISGRVLDMTGAPISGATVTGQKTGDTACTDTTDSRGIYALTKLSSASAYNVSVSYPGRAFFKQNVTTGTSADYGNNSGNRWQVDFVSSEAPPTAQDASADVVIGSPVTITLQAVDEGLPDPPGTLSYILQSLPALGSLSDPAAGVISSVPHALANGANQVIYTASSAGSDGFTFTANDGGSPPTGGDSNLATVSLNAAHCAPVTVGTGSTAWHYPMYTYRHDSRIQVIYLASELGPAAQIKALALDVTQVPGQTLNAWTIRIKHTALNAYPKATLENTGWTVVYQNTEPPGEPGWRTFTFTTPFNYNGTNNLMVDFSHNNTSFSTSGYCTASTPGGERTACAYSDSRYGDPLLWAGTNLPTVLGNTNVPNVRFTLCGLPSPPRAPSDFGHSSNTIDSITWTWLDMSGNEDGFRGQDNTHTQRWTVGANATRCTESGLSANTAYNRHVHAYNGAGESDPSGAATVYTAIEPVTGLEFGPVANDRIEVRSVNSPSNLTAGNSGLNLRNETAAATSGWVQANNYWPSSSLVANTPYTFTGQSRNGDGEVTALVTATKWTRPTSPAVTSSEPTHCPATLPGQGFTFTSTPVFGPGGVDHYHYLWDTAADAMPTAETPTVWAGGVLALTADSPGRWHLHLVSHNGEHAPGGVMHLGPFVVSDLPAAGFSAGDYDQDCDVDSDDLLRFLRCAAGPDLPVPPNCLGTSLDGDADADQTDFGIFQQCWTGGAPSDPLCGR